MDFKEDMDTSFVSSWFDEEVKRVTEDGVSELFMKWSTMYEFTDELKENRLRTCLDYIKELFDNIISSEEERRQGMLNEIDALTKEVYSLQKELQLPGLEDIIMPHVKQPYSLTIEKIKNNRNEYIKLRDERLTKMKSLRDKERELCDKLEMSLIPEFENKIPYENQLEEIETHIFELMEEQENRMQYYRESKEKLIGLFKELEYEPSSDFELDLITDYEEMFVPSQTNMNKLKNTRLFFEKEREDKLSDRNGLLVRLNKLWDRINVEQPERDDFLSRFTGIGKSHIKAIEVEIKKSEEIMFANMKPVTERIRQEISNMWDLLTFTDEQRSQFRAFTTDYLSEDVFHLHELELEKLTAHYEKYKHIFFLAEKRNQLWERMRHLDEQAMDKNRLFNNRGGQLLKEEKERKTLEVSLPKVDKQLKNALEEFHAAEGQPFLWHGVDLLTRITEEWEQRIAAKESKKTAKKVESGGGVRSNYRVVKRKHEDESLNPCMNGAKARRCDDLGSQTIILKGGVRTPGKLPNIRTPLNVSTASIASYSHFQDGLEKSQAVTPRSALKEVGNKVPGIGHSSPTLSTPVGRRGTPGSVVKSNPHTIPRLARYRTRLPLDF